MAHSRFAIYFLPTDGALAEFGAGWLGWDVVRGCAVPQTDLPGLKDVTAQPRKYGFHATLKPPFSLAKGRRLDTLEVATGELASRLAPAHCDGLELTVLGRFLALTPRGDATPLRHVADACVRDLDGFRAPATVAELARRRKSNLTQRQEALLSRWGYPHVMEEFRFHMTLTGRLPKRDIPAWTETVKRQLPALPAPFVLDQIALCGERADGYFELLRRYPLGG